MWCPLPSEVLHPHAEALLKSLVVCQDVLNMIKDYCIEHYRVREEVAEKYTKGLQHATILSNHVLVLFYVDCLITYDLEDDCDMLRRLEKQMYPHGRLELGMRLIPHVNFQHGRRREAVYFTQHPIVYRYSLRSGIVYQNHNCETMQVDDERVLRNGFSANQTEVAIRKWRGTEPTLPQLFKPSGGFRHDGRYFVIACDTSNPAFITQDREVHIGIRNGFYNTHMPGKRDIYIPRILQVTKHWMLCDDGKLTYLYYTRTRRCKFSKASLGAGVCHVCESAQVPSLYVSRPYANACVRVVRKQCGVCHEGCARVFGPHSFHPHAALSWA